MRHGSPLGGEKQCDDMIAEEVAAVFLLLNIKASVPRWRRRIFINATPLEKNIERILLAVWIDVSLKALMYSSRSLLSIESETTLEKRGPFYQGHKLSWAIKGAIGSKSKIDASYLSPDVNMSEKSTPRAIDLCNPTSTHRQQSSVYAGKQRVFLVRLPISFGIHNSALLISLQSSSISLQVS
jgi:hypothetical protein